MCGCARTGCNHSLLISKTRQLQPVPSLFQSFSVQFSPVLWSYGLDLQALLNLYMVILPTVLDSVQSLIPYSSPWKQSKDMPAHHLECLSNAMDSKACVNFRMMPAIKTWFPQHFCTLGMLPTCIIVKECMW